MNRPAHYLPFETVEEAEAAGYNSGTLANGDTFGDEDDETANDYSDARDAACEAASDYVLGLNNAEFATLNGGTDALLDALRKAVSAWERWRDSMGDRD